MSENLPEPVVQAYRYFVAKRALRKTHRGGFFDPSWSIHIESLAFKERSQWLAACLTTKLEPEIHANIHILCGDDEYVTITADHINFTAVSEPLDIITQACQLEDCGRLMTIHAPERVFCGISLLDFVIFVSLIDVSKKLIMKNSLSFDTLRNDYYMRLASLQLFKLNFDIQNNTVTITRVSFIDYQRLDPIEFRETLIPGQS